MTQVTEAAAPSPANSEVLAAEAERIIASGALGRSPVYATLLRYLADCVRRGDSPKEVEIAIEVLGKNADHDVGRDSSVRVYVHQLRKKLSQYYQRHAPEAAWKLTIPKGQYTLEAADQQADPDVGSAIDKSSDSSWPWWRLAWRSAVLLLLAANLWTWSGTFGNDHGNQLGAVQERLLAPLLNDSTPILVAMGDYYIFGELDEAGNISRMIRDFDINSAEDLQRRFIEQPKLGWRYYDLDLNYLPEGSAFALADLMPVLASTGKSVDVKMMSDLSTRDLRQHHVVYIGYISALERISRLVFSVSELRVGENYDQLVRKDGGQVFTSSAGLPSFNDTFVDYGWLMTVPTTEDNRLLVVSGMRDSGLIHSAHSLATGEGLATLKNELAGEDETAALEALFEVRGMERMNFEFSLEHAGYLDAAGLWGELQLDRR